STRRQSAGGASAPHGGAIAGGLARAGHRALSHAERARRARAPAPGRRPDRLNHAVRSHHQKGDSMIYEIRTYQVKVGSLAEVEKRFGEAYEYRKKYSPLAAFWHTEIGPLNEIIHVWPYTDAADRARVRAEAAKDPNWPPKIQEFILKMQSELLVPFP